MPSRFSINALGVPIDIELIGFSESDADIVKGAWSRLLVTEVSHPATTISIQPPSIEALATRITLAAIEGARDDLLMLHAGGVADPSGKTIAFVGASGRGKTTASMALGTTYGYVSDETVGIRSDHSVVPYEKPLSIVTEGSSRKRQASPDTLGLLVAPDALRLHRVVLLDRQADAPEVPVVTSVELADAIKDLVPQTSYLSALDGGLQRIAAATAGLVRVTYREAETLAAVFAELFASDIPVGEPWKPAPAIPGEGGMRRAPYVDAITDGRRVIVLHDDTVRVLDGIGSTVWLASVGLELDEIIKIVIARHGEPPSGSAAEHVDEAVAQLRGAGVLNPL